MPIFLDRHDMVEQSAAETAMLHVKDLEIQDQYGVKFLTYWYDTERRTTFCLVDAPDKKTADKVHAEAHGYPTAPPWGLPRPRRRNFIQRTRLPYPETRRSRRIVSNISRAATPSDRSSWFTHLRDEFDREYDLQFGQCAAQAHRRAVGYGLLT